MSKVTEQEIVEALRGPIGAIGNAKRKELADRIEAHGIAPPGGIVLVKDEPVCWAITGDGKFGEKRFGDTFEPLPDSLGYWDGRGYDAIPLYASPEVKP